MLTLRAEMGLAVMRALALPKVEIEQPVNMCPDDDPPGERPTEKVWATDAGAIADAILTSPALALARAEAWEEGRQSAMDDAHYCDGFDDRANPYKH